MYSPTGGLFWRGFGPSQFSDQSHVHAFTHYNHGSVWWSFIILFCLLSTIVFTCILLRHVLHQRPSVVVVNQLIHQSKNQRPTISVLMQVKEFWQLMVINT